MASRGKESRRPADDFDDGDDGSRGYPSTAPSGRGGASSARRGDPDDDFREEEGASARSKGAAKSRPGPLRAYESDQDEPEPPSRGGRPGDSRALVMRNKSTRAGAQDYDDEPKASSRGGKTGNSRALVARYKSKRGGEEDYNDESEPPSRGGRLGNSRAPVSRNKSKRAEEEDYDDEPEPPSRSGKSGNSRALVTRNKSRRAEEEDDDDNDKAPSRGGRAGGSRAMVTRNNGKQVDEDTETVTLSRYEPMLPGELCAADFHGLIRLFGITKMQIGSWCERRKLVWDIKNDKPSFHKLAAMYPEKAAALDDLDESREFALAHERKAEMMHHARVEEAAVIRRNARVVVEMERQARGEERAERMHCTRMAHHIAREDHIARYGW